MSEGAAVGFLNPAVLLCVGLIALSHSYQRTFQEEWEDRAKLLLSRFREKCARREQRIAREWTLLCRQWRKVLRENETAECEHQRSISAIRCALSSLRSSVSTHLRFLPIPLS